MSSRYWSHLECRWVDSSGAPEPSLTQEAWAARPAEPATQTRAPATDVPRQRPADPALTG